MICCCIGMLGAMNLSSIFGIYIWRLAYRVNSASLLTCIPFLFINMSEFILEDPSMLGTAVLTLPSRVDSRCYHPSDLTWYLLAVAVEFWEDPVEGTA